MHLDIHLHQNPKTQPHLQENHPLRPGRHHRHRLGRRCFLCRHCLYLRSPKDQVGKHRQNQESRLHHHLYLDYSRLRQNQCPNSR